METQSKVDAKYHFYKREFLNLPGFHSHGHVICSIEKNRYDRKYVEARVDIADCCKVITLDFGAGNSEEQGYENAIFKFDTLIKALTDMKEVYLKVAEEAKKLGEDKD